MMKSKDINRMHTVTSANESIAKGITSIMATLPNLITGLTNNYKLHN